MATLFRYTSTRPKNLSFLTGLSVMLMMLAGITLFGTHHISAASCTTNDIIRCGFSTPHDFISKVEANDSGSGQHDLQAIYAHYGLSQSDYSDFAAHAIQGEAMRDGRIIVNGKVVGTGGKSIGRLKSFQGSNPFAVNIDGHTYWGNVNSQAFASGVSEIPIDVLLNSNGTLKFAVMPSCGNPEFPTKVTPPPPPPPVKSSAACKVLNEQPVQGKSDTFNFKASATTSGDASIVKFVYDFGDGSPAVTETSGDTPVTHTYKSTGTFTASVTVFANLPGQPDKQLPPVEMCAKKITIAPPPSIQVACKELVGMPTDNSGSKLAFTFTATAVPTSGATLTSADFDFGDGSTQQNVPANSDGLTVTGQHTYQNAGTFTASAVLHFNSSGQSVTAPACTTIVTPVTPAVTPPSPPPVVTATSTTVLPNTGAGDVIGLFFAASALGALVFRRMLQHRSRRNGL